VVQKLNDEFSGLPKQRFLEGVFPADSRLTYARRRFLRGLTKQKDEVPQLLKGLVESAERYSRKAKRASRSQIEIAAKLADALATCCRAFQTPEPARCVSPKAARKLAGPPDFLRLGRSQVTPLGRIDRLARDLDKLNSDFYLSPIFSLSNQAARRRREPPSPWLEEASRRVEEQAWTLSEIPEQLQFYAFVLRGLVYPRHRKVRSDRSIYRREWRRNRANECEMQFLDILQELSGKLHLDEASELLEATVKLARRMHRSTAKRKMGVDALQGRRSRYMEVAKPVVRVSDSSIQRWLILNFFIPFEDAFPPF
jgi:hypothetical protein